MARDTGDPRRGGPAKELAFESAERGYSKPAIILCPECGAENIQGTDNCVNCNGDLRTLDIPPDTWSPGMGPPGEHVGKIARQQPLEVRPATSVREVIAHLRDSDQGCAVVVEGGRVIGVFTERDLLNRVTAQRERALDRPVAELMTPDPVLLREDDSILVAINKMGIGGFRHIPLVDENRALRGVLSGRDILSYVDGLVGGGAS